LSDQELSDLVRSHRIDILVDLALHLAGNRMPVFARKPAPIQVSAFEVIATTGLDTIDYRLTDPYLDPPGQTDGDYTEQSIRLPHCFWCYRPPREAPPVAPLPASKNGFITFGAFNSFLKFNRPTLALWARVLHAVPTARMIVHSASPAHREFTQNAFEAANVDSGRIDFTPTVSRGEYLRRHHHVDIGLDTQPYAGATTTMDALWMGVPVITLAGCTAVGRAGVSILTNLGLPDLVAHTPDQYVEIAARRAVDLAGVRKLRAGLRQQMLASPLMDGPRYARDVEAALRTMWRTWCGS
jgi:predicted O-linked N-acetylglucosamine transferase (SPINDLY family)